MRVGIVFPHQIFEENPLVKLVDKIYLVEDSLFFGDKFTKIHFHKKKLMFHRASMKAYESFLTSNFNTIQIEYIEYNKNKTITDIVANIVKEDEIFIIDPVDFLLSKRLTQTKRNITFIDSPLFLNTKKDNEEYINKYGRKRNLLMHHFYVWQRKRMNILVDCDGKPNGGKWSFDDENQKKVSKKLIAELPCQPKEQINRYVTEAKQYILKNFPNNYGSTENFFYPISHTESKKWLRNFLAYRLHDFGTYEDAIVKENSVVYHSLLSPLMNVGLITPALVVQKTLQHAQKQIVPINCLEAFVRQVIGWREFMRLVYEEKGCEMRNTNFFEHKNKLGAEYWCGETGIFPVDTTIKKVLATGYCHHIERLMILSNFMLLTHRDPDDVYIWFMEMFIDSYDWVMVPNVYGMGQFADGGFFATKPYISGSNYILKMSDYKKDTWSDIWDALYWLFLQKHKNKFNNNHRMTLMLRLLKNKTDNDFWTYKKVAKDFI